MKTSESEDGRWGNGRVLTDNDPFPNLSPTMTGHEAWCFCAPSQAAGLAFWEPEGRAADLSMGPEIRTLMSGPWRLPYYTSPSLTPAPLGPFTKPV